MLKRLTLAPTVFILIFIIKATYGHFEDPDFYWHVKTGEYIWASGVLPHADVFSYTQPGKPWVLHEWLFQIIIYLVYRSGGTLGVNVLVALFYTACCYLMFRSVRLLLAGNDSKVLIVTLLCGSLFTGVAPRPYLFTFLLFSLFLYRLILFKYEQDHSHLWVFPVIMPFWTNVHGGYFIGIFLLCLFMALECLGSLVHVGKGAVERRALAHLAIATGAAILATLINPEFIKHWWYPFQVIGMDASKGFIEEWRSPDFHQPFFQYFLAVVVGSVGMVLYSGRRLDLTEFGMPVVFVGSAFIARRNIPLAAIVLAPFLALQLKTAVSRLESTVKELSTKSSSRMVKVISRSLDTAMRAPEVPSRSESFINALLIVLTLISLVVLYPSRQKEMRETLNTIIPVKATDFVVRNNIHGHMFNAYHYGGYLIYRLFPTQKVFIDGRADMYGDAFINYANGVYEGQSLWRQAFDKYQVDYVMCESESPIRQLLLVGGQFKLVFDDRMHSVLVKNTEQFQSLIRKYDGRPEHG